MYVFPSEIILKKRGIDNLERCTFSLLGGKKYSKQHTFGL